LFYVNLRELTCEDVDWSRQTYRGTVWGTMNQSLGMKIPTFQRLIMALTFKEIDTRSRRSQKYKMLGAWRVSRDHFVDERGCKIYQKVSGR
jgi:hypothetical protein